MGNHFDMDKHYVGSFEIEGRKFEGEIVHNIQTGVIRLAVTFQLNSFNEFSIKYSNNSNVIIGRLTSGTVVNLFNNKLIKNHTQNFQYQSLVYSVEFMILSNKELPTPKFEKMICEIENGLLWSCLSGIEIKELTSVCYKGYSPKTFYWFDAQITFSTTINNGLLSLPRKEVCELEERLLVTIEANEKKDVSFFTDIRDKILSMISFATKDNINIIHQKFLECCDSSISTEKGICSEHLLIENKPLCDIYNTHFFEYNFNLNYLPDDDPEISQKLVKLAPIFNLYLSLFKYPHMPNEMVFLNIVQALETFHARFFYNDDKKKYIKSVKERFDEGSWQYNLLLSDTQVDPNCSFIILVSRLNDLIISGKNDIFVGLCRNDSEFAQRIADTRHYYTHYSESKKDKALKGDNLLESTCILSIILEYYVCDKLGIDISNHVTKDLQHFITNTRE